MLTIPERAHYRTDHGFSLLRLNVALLIGGCAALMAGFVLELAYLFDLYLVLLVPAVVAAGLAVLMYWLMRWSRCRNTVLACGICMSIGATGFLSQYAWDMIIEESTEDQLVLRLDHLPSYIHFRISHDTIVATPSLSGQSRNDGSPVGNWIATWISRNQIVFTLELLMFVVLPAIASYECARQVFDTARQRWAKTENCYIPAFSSEVLVDALAKHNLPATIAALEIVWSDFLAQGGKFDATAMLTIEFVDGNTDLLDRPVYLTIKDYREVPGKRLEHHNFECRRVMLTLEELLALRVWFKKLDKKLTTLDATVATKLTPNELAVAMFPSGLIRNNLTNWPTNNTLHIK